MYSPEVVLKKPYVVVDEFELWKVKKEFELPDNTRWSGDSPSIAIILRLISSDSPLPIVLAAPVVPDVEFATMWDLVFMDDGGPGFNFSVVLPAACEIPVDSLEAKLFSWKVPDVVKEAAIKVATSGAELLETCELSFLPEEVRGEFRVDLSYLKLIDTLKDEWSYLVKCRMHINNLEKACRLATLEIPRLKIKKDFPLAAASKSRTSFADESIAQLVLMKGDIVLAVVPRANVFEIEIDSCLETANFFKKLQLEKIPSRMLINIGKEIFVIYIKNM